MEIIQPIMQGLQGLFGALTGTLGGLFNSVAGIPQTLFSSLG